MTVSTVEIISGRIKAASELSKILVHRAPNGKFDAVFAGTAVSSQTLLAKGIGYVGVFYGKVGAVQFEKIVAG